MLSSTPNPTASSPQDPPTRPWELLIFLDTAPDRGTMVSSAFATKDEAKAQLAEVVRSTNSSEGSIYATLADDGMSCELFFPRGEETVERIQKYWVQYPFFKEEDEMKVDEKKPKPLRMNGYNID